MTVRVPLRVVGKRVFACFIVLLSCFMLKLFYQNADSEALVWILAPVAFLSECLTGLSFQHETGAGWVNLDHMIVIAPACSGVNFMIIAYCMSSCKALFSQTKLREMLLLVCVAAVASFCMTILANTLRIHLSIYLYQTDVYTKWLTPSAAHRVLGVTVYFSFLLFYYQSLSFIFQGINDRDSREQPARKSTAVMRMAPLCWYLLFSLGIPYVRSGSIRTSGQFAEHAQIVLMTSVLVAALVVLAASVLRYFRYYLRQ